MSQKYLYLNIITNVNAFNSIVTMNCTDQINIQ